jgi:hypothetical protein
VVLRRYIFIYIYIYINKVESPIECGNLNCVEETRKAEVQRQVWDVDSRGQRAELKGQSNSSSLPSEWYLL